MQIKAALFREHHKPLSIESVEIDTPGPHEVLIQTVASGVCHSDLHALHGNLPVRLPAVLGHEPAGIVEAVGSEVRAVQAGDHVVACTSMYCGTCTQCLSGYLHLCSNRSACLRPKGSQPRLTQKGDAVAQFADLASFDEKMMLHERA